MIEPLLLHAYADGELNAEERARLESELRTCLESQAELRAIQSVKHALKTGATSVTVVEYRECWSVCQGRLKEIDGARRTERFVGRYAWAMAAGVVGLIAVTGIVRRGTPGSTMEGADLARIMSQIGPGAARPTRNDAIEQARAAELLRRARLSVDPNALRVRGVTEMVEDGMLMRRILIEDGRGAMALLDLPGSVQLDGLSGLPGTSLLAGHFDRMECVAWPCGDRQLVLVGPRDHAALARVAAAIHAVN